MMFYNMMSYTFFAQYKNACFRFPVKKKKRGERGGKKRSNRSNYSRLFLRRGQLKNEKRNCNSISLLKSPFFNLQHALLEILSQLVEILFGEKTPSVQVAIVRTYIYVDNTRVVASFLDMIKNTKQQRCTFWTFFKRRQA